MIEYKLAKSSDIESILLLQQKNLSLNLAQNESDTEGFVTLVHSYQLLKKMNSPFPHIIAKHNEQLIGYALTLVKEMQNEVSGLAEMYQKINTISIDDRPLNRISFYTMGQVCVDKDYRKQGVFRGLYDNIKKEMSGNFEYVVTEVSAKNQRSLNAHLAIGFQILLEFESKSKEIWVLIALNLRSQEMHLN